MGLAQVNVSQWLLHGFKHKSCTANQLCQNTFCLQIPRNICFSEIRAVL